jgi:hypothetical protein
MYLLDSNILVELLLDQDRADEVEECLRALEPGTAFLSELSLHSIGIILLQHKVPEVFMRFWADLLSPGAVRLVRLSLGDMPMVVDAASRFGLDFDDAYQYVTATKHGYTLLSFDTHFDRTDLQRRTPGEVS